MYKRAEYQIIKNRLEEPRKFIQVVMGARQIGKSTVVKQVLKDLDVPYLFYSADNVPASNAAWVSDCWEAVRSLERSNNWESAMTKWISYFARRIHWWQLRSRAMRRNVLKVWTSSASFSSRHRHSLSATAVSRPKNSCRWT